LSKFSSPHEDSLPPSPRARLSQSVFGSFFMRLCSGTSVVISVGAITMNRQPSSTIAFRMSSRSRSI
jgi:hypothetical protein